MARIDRTDDEREFLKLATGSADLDDVDDAFLRGHERGYEDGEMYERITVCHWLREMGPVGSMFANMIEDGDHEETPDINFDDVVADIDGSSCPD